MTTDEQLEKWVNGESLHNHERSIDIVDDDGNVIATEEMKGGECCPDFSCCHPGMKWPIEKRFEFAKAIAAGDDEKKMSMLMGALKDLMDYQEIRNVHLVGSVSD